MAFAPLWFRPRCVDTGRRGEHSENTRRSHAHRNVRADWVGKTITYDGGQFVLEGKGNIRAADVMEYDRQSQGHSGSVNRRGSANVPHVVACISPACRWIAMHVHPTPAGASGHRWLGSPAAEKPNLAIVRCAGHRR